MITNVLLQTAELSQEILLIPNNFPGGSMPSLCVASCWLWCATELLVSWTGSPGWCPKWGKFSPWAMGTRKLFSMLHPEQVLVLKCPTSLPVTVPKIPIVIPHKSSPLAFFIREDEWGLLLSPCLTLHIFLADFMPLLLLIYKLDSMFLGFAWPLHWVALEEESQKKTPCKKQVW